MNSSSSTINGHGAGTAATINGLSSEEAERLLEQYGANEPVKAKRGASLLELFSLLLIHWL